MDQAKHEELNRLAGEVLDISRNRLLVNLRYMDTALAFHGRELCHGSFGTDGRVLYYDPAFVLRTYAESKEKLTRIYLHSVLHCIFCNHFREVIPTAYTLITIMINTLNRIF